MKTASTPRAHSIDTALLTEVTAGLLKPRKTLPCKLFYDEQGARLFERICLLPEYYPTRTELQILRTHGGAMAAWIGAAARIVEFGSGSGEKTRILLAHAADVTEYVPIDIAHSQLQAFARDLGRSLPWLHVRPVCGDYTRELTLPAPAQPGTRTVVFFPGSTIGNFEPAQACAFLRNAAKICGPGGGLLIGVDLRKDKATLERAYNDSQGITAAFNLNMLTHINRVCDADFEVTAFAHRAIYDEARGRIEMQLISRAPQVVTLARSTPRPTRIHFAAHEAILTEYSYKYDVPDFQTLAGRACFAPAAVWTDPHRRFSVHAFDVI